MRSRPPLGAAVTLERNGVRWLEAEAIGYAEGDVVLRLESDAPALGAVPVPVWLRWSTDRGLFGTEAEATRDGTRDDGVCRVRLLARTERLQRRAHPRLPMGTQLTLSHRTGTTRGTLVDVSEAALRARIERSPDGPGGPDETFEPGAHVRVAFTLHHTGFVLTGTVLREQPAHDEIDGDEQPGAVGSTDVVVLLDIPAETANDLRRRVAFEQIQRQHPAETSPRDTRDVTR